MLFIYATIFNVSYSVNYLRVKYKKYLRFNINFE